MKPNTVGDRIKAMRLRRGWSQATLAAAAGVGQSTVSMLERGHRSGDGKSILAIAAALGIPAEQLYSEENAGTEKTSIMYTQESPPSLAPSVAEPVDETYLRRPREGIRLEEAINLVLDKMSKSPHREELMALFAMIMTHDAPIYRQRVFELLCKRDASA